MIIDRGKPKIVSRQDAIARGFTQYFTGIECRDHHVAARRVHNSACVECSREKNRLRRLNGATSKPLTAESVEAQRGEQRVRTRAFLDNAELQDVFIEEIRDVEIAQECLGARLLGEVFSNDDVMTY